MGDLCWHRYQVAVMPWVDDNGAVHSAWQNLSYKQIIL